MYQSELVETKWLWGIVGSIFFQIRVPCGFMRSGHLSVFNLFLKKYHGLASTASDREGIIYQWKIEFCWSIPQKGAIIGHLGARDDPTIRISKFFDELRLLRSLRPPRSLRLLRPLRPMRFLMPGKSVSTCCACWFFSEIKTSEASPNGQKGKISILGV